MQSYLLRQKVTEPEFAVGVLEVGALVATIAVHSVRIDHEVELLSFLLESINQEKSVLMVHVVVSCSVSDLQHYRIHCWSRRGRGSRRRARDSTSRRGYKRRLPEMNSDCRS